MERALSDEQVLARDRVRNLAGKPFRAACYAPFTSMYFDVHGNVIACCQNTTHVLGNVHEDSLIDIWRGPQAEELRTALRADDLSRGCEFCRWQTDDGNFDALFSNTFDTLPVDDTPQFWPAQLELALSNTCNLECVMCHGEFSSMIRAHREKLPPLPAQYGDRFFAELRPFLRHAQQVRFFGGEPFLARESFRIWDLMIKGGVTAESNVTTNGTQWNDRIERVLHELPFALGISMDGLTRETVEAVRVNASYDALMANFGRFHAYSNDRGKPLGLTYCVMVPNWHEFGDFLRFADEHGCPVYTNTVVFPAHLSLYRLPAREFTEILEALDLRDAELTKVLDLNLGVWQAELTRLRNWATRLDRRTSDLDADSVAVYFELSSGVASPLGARFLEFVGSHGVEPFDLAAAMDRLRSDHWLEEPTMLTVDAADVVVRAHDGFLGLEPGECEGRHFREILSQLEQRHGTNPQITDEHVNRQCADTTVRYSGMGSGDTHVRSVRFPTVDESGNIVGSTTVAVPITPSDPPARTQRVTLRRPSAR